MPTLQQYPQDVQYVVLLASSGSIAIGKPAALIAAVALSAGNSNGPVLLCDAQESVFSTTAPATTVGMPNQAQGQATPLLAYVLQSAATLYYPLEAARNAAITLSQSNSGAQVIIFRVHTVVTAP